MTGETDHVQELSQESPQLPEFGLSIDEVRLLLISKHDTHLTKDDPVLMLVSIFNAFLEKQDLLLQKHNDAFKKTIIQQTEVHLAEFEKTLKLIQNSMSDSAVVAVAKLFEEYRRDLHQQRINNFWTAGVVALSAAVFLIVQVIL